MGKKGVEMITYGPCAKKKEVERGREPANGKRRTFDDEVCVYPLQCSVAAILQFISLKKLE